MHARPIETAATEFASLPIQKTTSKIRILVADDHPIFRECLISVLAEMGNLEVIACAEDGWQAVALTIELHPDLVLMDVDMPRMDGIEATREIAKAMPDVCVIGVSMHSENSAIAERMRAAGAAGYFAKDGSPESLFAAIQSQLAVAEPQ